MSRKSFEDSLVPGIPLAEAASFFIRVKTGAPLDPTIDEETEENKTAGLRRVQRISAAGLKSPNISEGLLGAGERAIQKLRNRASHAAGGSDGWMRTNGLNPDKRPAGADSMAEIMLHAKPQGAVEKVSAAARFKLALAEFGVPPHSDDGNMEPGVPEEDPGLGHVPAQGAAPDELQGYLQQESAAMAAADQAATDFYQAKAQAAQAQAQSMQEQVGQLTQQIQGLQQQIDQSQGQIQSSMQEAQIAQQAAIQNVQKAHAAASQATSQAMQSMEEVLRQKQLAAAMRMGAIQLKDQVMGALTQDPTEQLAQQLQSPPPSTGGMGGPPQSGQVDPSTGQPMQQMGQPAPQQAAPQQGAEAPAPQEAAPKKPPAAKKPGGGTHVTVSTGEKKASIGTEIAKRAPYAAAGAAGGALLGHGFAKMDNSGLRQKVQDMDQQQGPRTFGASFNLAQAKIRLALGEAAEEHPGATAAIGGVLGGLSAGANAPAIKEKIPMIMDARAKTNKLQQLAKGLAG